MIVWTIEIKPRESATFTVGAKTTGHPGAHGPYFEDERGPDVQRRVPAQMRATGAVRGGIAIAAPALGLRSAHRRGGITA